MEVAINYAKFFPELLNLVIVFLSIHALLKLTKMRIDATIALGKKDKESKGSEKGPVGFLESLGWVCVNRLPELIIAGIAIPDIPVLVKLITG